MEIFYALREPYQKLQEVLDKLNRTHPGCHPYDYTECDYIYSQVNDKEAFIDAITQAMKSIELASSFTRK